MPNWVGNNMYIKIEDGNLGAGVEIQANWKTVKLNGDVEAVEVTRGPNKTHKMAEPGMNDYGLEITLGIDSDDVFPDHLRLNQKYTITIAPNGNTSGQPCHKGVFFLTAVPLDVETDKSERVYATKWKQADAPTINYFEGGVVA